MEQLSPSKFTWEKYIGKVGFAATQLFADPWANKPKLNPDVTVIGYCPAKDIRIRSRPQGLVIMVEMNGEEFWFHNDELPV
jgi:hypothetical protein